MKAETAANDTGETDEEAAAAQKAPAGSLTLKSAAALAIAYVAGRFGAQLPEGAAQDIASAVIDLVFALGLLGVGVGRTRARGPIV